MDVLKYLKKIQDLNGEVSSDLVLDIIKEHLPWRTKMIRQYNHYKGINTAISKRKNLDVEHLETSDGIIRLDSKVNNKLHNTFDAEIVDTKIGYMFGKPVSYDLDDTRKSYNSLTEELQNFKIRNTLEDADSEIAKMSAICGYGSRLCYVDLEGQIKIKNIDPFNAILIGEDITSPDYAIYYYLYDEDKMHVEFYNEQKYRVFEGTEIDLKFVDEKEHNFKYNPLFGVPNNKELQSDSEKVMSLIEAYDLAISDQSSEITQSRLSYLVVSGMVMDKEDVREVNQSGVFSLMDNTQNVSYLTKSVDGTIINDLLNRLEDNIMRFAKSVNFNDEAFGGNSSGVAIRYKLMALEHKCVTFERKFSSMLRYQFKVIFSALQKLNSEVDDNTYLDVFFTFTRNLPVNKLEEAQVLNTLGARLSERTALAQSTLVDDVDFELEQRDIEMSEAMSQMQDMQLESKEV